MTTTVAGILLASLLGSAHCAAMCGGFVCFYASDTHRLRSHAAYNVGRLMSYAALGAVAGIIGSGITHAGVLAGVGRGAAIVAGTLMILWGGAGILTAAGVPAGRSAGVLARRLLEPGLRRALDLVRERPVPVRAFTLGVATALLPCGWLYVFVVAAGSTGNPASGAVIMATFWLGTVPAMLAVGFGAQKLFGSLRQRLPAISAAAILVIGILTLTGRLTMDAVRHGH